MAILTYDDLKARTAANVHYDSYLIAQNYLCASCGSDGSKRPRTGDFAMRFADDIVPGGPHELICHQCACALREETGKAERLKQLMREQERREEYVAQLASGYLYDDL